MNRFVFLFVVLFVLSCDSDCSLTKNHYLETDKQLAMGQANGLVSCKKPEPEIVRVSHHPDCEGKKSESVITVQVCGKVITFHCTADDSHNRICSEQ